MPCKIRQGEKQRTENIVLFFFDRIIEFGRKIKEDFEARSHRETLKANIALRNVGILLG